MKDTRMTRRDFLRLSALTTGGLLLAGCSANSAQYPDRKQVRLILDSWGLTMAPFQEMAKRSTGSRTDVEVRVEASPGGWQTKVNGQIKANKLEFSTAGVLTTVNDLQAWVLLDIIQPADKFFQASAEPGAPAFLDDLLPPIKADIQYQDQIFALPFSIEGISFLWNTELFGKAGVTSAPKTWQELYDSCKALKDYLAANGTKDVYPLGFDLGGVARNLGALLCSISDKPYNEEGLLDWESEEMKECLRFMRKLSTDGLTPPSAGEGLEIYDMWMRGRLGALYSISSRNIWAAKNLGFDKIRTESLPTYDGKAHAGTVYWSNAVALLNKGPYPQEALDFLIYAMGPQNTDWQKSIIKAGQSPAHVSSYDLLNTDPELEPYRWMADLRKDIEVSLPAPKNYYYQIENATWTKWRPSYLKDGSTMTEDELIQNVLKSTRETMENVVKSVPTIKP